jgi:hypothetical protein
MSWFLVHSALKGFHPNIFNSTSGGVHLGEIFCIAIGRAVLEACFYLATIDRMHVETHVLMGGGGFKKYAVEMGSVVIKCISIFVKIG